jgi:superfamily I DNA/RNA helicase
MKRDKRQKKGDSMKTWLLKRSDLSGEQEQTVKMSPQENSLVLGLPGSGKTQVLIQRAAYLIQYHGISSRKIRVFVFTDVIEEFIRSEIRSAGFPEEMVTTFDRWCHSFYVEHISQDLPRVYINGRVDYKKTHFAVFEALKKNESLQKSLEFALVDDGQDLTPEVWEILCLAAHHVTVIADPHHKLYQEGASESFILDKLGLNKRTFFLQRDYRSSLAVAQLASHFIEEDNYRRAYLSQIRDVHSSSKDPLCYVASSEEKELFHLSQVVQQSQVIKDKVGILVPTSSLVHRVTKALKDRGIETEKAITRDAQNVIHSPYDFGNSLPKVTTYHMAKGLTFDSVLMPQLTESAFAKIPSSLRHWLLFVGIARASRWVYLSTVKGKEFREMDILKAAAKKGHLRILHRLSPFQ